MPRWPLILLGALLILLLIVFLLPASLIARFLPKQVQMSDFSGSLLHGAAGSVRVNGQDAGALEWHLHPAALLTLSASADIHWVKVSFVIDGSARIDRHGVTAEQVHGGGPIESLAGLGSAADWRGTAQVSFKELRSDFHRLLSADGTLEVTDLSSTRVAGGDNLGNYQLKLGPASFAPDGALTADLSDTGGPLEVAAQIHYSPETHVGLFSGTLKDRPDAGSNLRDQLAQLARVRPRDANGRFPVDLEFNL